ncbi:MAG TPA: TRAP transporter small permease [Rubrivivax sp.]|nr:TRAP transporter small permease [Pseudomonadota bacterium]MCW5639262.1 TRAP transporter small permease [Rubrivivax sp.]HRY89341.1 TRAP transporter small permease [Rubrivivax sp.]HRZ61551.1 TRAP transporter small permease [Rubrivivax sp.]
MHEPPVDAPAGTAAGFGPFGRALLAVSKAAAVVGGLVFVAIVAMSIVSIVGRKLVSMPVPGDFELVEMGSAVGASFFFAYCHLNRGDVKVDFFTQHWSAAKVMWLDAIGSTLIGLFGAVVAWRTAVGAFALREVGESSAILDWPMWVVRLAMVPGFVLMALAGFYMAAHFVRAARRGALA